MCLSVMYANDLVAYLLIQNGKGKLRITVSTFFDAEVLWCVGWNGQVGYNCGLCTLQKPLGNDVFLQRIGSCKHRFAGQLQ